MSESAGKLAHAIGGAVGGGAVVAQSVSALGCVCKHRDEVAYALVVKGGFRECPRSGL